MANCAYVHSDCTIHEYQFLKTMEDVELMTEYDVMEALKRVRGEDETVMPQGVPDTWRYLPLFDYFGKVFSKVLKFEDYSSKNKTATNA